ncbi:MAG: hypothetical protein EA403_00340 [Spirochaetaceae bacterium]|nr:MAG: hypothetical protein EA384_01915 [Spirochaetaceae bacterium]TVR06900.1 MAG: hypothetical protein EA403_00340 [Spirochaetaceae bacterium]
MLGRAGFVMMFYQFVMAARLGVIERAFARAVIYRRHRTLGKIGFLLMLLHAIAMLAFDLIMAGELILDTGKTAGLVALVLLTIPVVVAIFWKPLRLSSKQWTRIHRIAWVAFPLAFYHAVTLGTTINTSQAVMALFYAMALGYSLLAGSTDRSGGRRPQDPHRAASRRGLRIRIRRPWASTRLAFSSRRRDLTVASTVKPASSANSRRGATRSIGSRQSPLRRHNSMMAAINRSSAGW